MQPFYSESLCIKINNGFRISYPVKGDATGVFKNGTGFMEELDLSWTGYNGRKNERWREAPALLRAGWKLMFLSNSYYLAAKIIFMVIMGTDIK